MWLFAWLEAWWLCVIYGCCSLGLPCLYRPQWALGSEVWSRDIHSHTCYKMPFEGSIKYIIPHVFFCLFICFGDVFVLFCFCFVKRTHGLQSAYRLNHAQVFFTMYFKKTVTVKGKKIYILLKYYLILFYYLIHFPIHN